MSEKSILGLHHVTCIASDPQQNLNFYTGVLGLRMVKLTVNFDDPSTYHSYFGDDAGSPGTLMTFFPWPGARRGRIGNDQASASTFSIPKGSAEYWLERFASLDIKAEILPERFGERVSQIEDSDGLILELVESNIDARSGRTSGPVPIVHAIRGLHSVTLSERDPSKTFELLTNTMGLREIAQDGNRTRFAVGDGNAGELVNVLNNPSGVQGLQGAGTVHHIAWRTANDEQQLDWLTTVADLGYGVSPVMDRTYFHSIYFREPGGVLFEIATDGPGFAVDEPAETLGHTLALPPQYESYRERIDETLPKLRRQDLVT